MLVSYLRFGMAQRNLRCKEEDHAQLPRLLKMFVGAREQLDHEARVDSDRDLGSDDKLIRKLSSRLEADKQV